MAVKEGKWRCPSCDAVNPGREMKCASCGNVRGEDVEFFLEEDAAEVTDEALLNRAAAGADWHCDFCGTDNRAGTEKCRQCGAPAEGMRRRQGKIQATGPAKPATPPAPVKKSPMRIFIPLAVIAAAVILFLVFGRGKEDSLRLESGEWSRSISVEQQEWVEKEDWEDQVPSKGEIIRTWEEQRTTEKIQVGTKQVKTGTKDMGNGFFEDVYEERPVYEERAVMDTKAKYRILEWEVYRTVEADGGLDDRPQWPDPDLSGGDREGRRSESATLYFRSTNPENEGKTYSYDLKPEEMLQFKKDKDYQAVVSGSRVRKFLEE